MSFAAQPTVHHVDGWRSSVIAAKAARSALVQRRRGSSERVRVLYYEAHSLLRAVHRHL